jgi:hypothetical protein
MRRRWFRALLILTVVGIGTGAAVLIPAAASRPGRAACQPSIDSLSATATSATTALVTASFSSGGASGGNWEMNISSPQTTKVVGDFGPPGGSISESLAGLVPDTHYRGSLTVHSDCGSVDALIDFRTPNAPVCTIPPAVDALQVASIGTDSAVVGYSISTGGAANAVLTLTPGGLDQPLSIAPPGGSGQVPLGNLAQNTAYTVTLTVTNACGQTSRQTTFTTSRLTDCTRPPTISGLLVDRLTTRSARIRYSVASDGVGRTTFVFRPGGTEVSRAISAPGGVESFLLHRLRPGTPYRIGVSASNACGQASDSATFAALGRVAVAVVGSGRVASSPRGIACRRLCAGAFRAGTTVLLVERPARGWRFLSWGGDCRGSARVCRVKAGNAQVTARFGRLP